MGPGLHAPETQMIATCLITGSAGKLGTALCHAFSETHRVAAIYRKSMPRFSSQLQTRMDLEESREKKDSAHLPFCVQGNLTQSEDIRRIVEVVLARFDRIDVLINAAADTRFHGRLLELSFGTAEVEHQLLTNCLAPMHLVSAVFQESWKHERAANREFNRCVINISSVSGLIAYPSVGQGFYSASKAALNFLTKHLANELADYCVRANAVCPSRFPETVPTETVVAGVKALATSQVSGEVIEVTRASTNYAGR
jgi:NAD(P)-dependent dehydrogenase (short-subunit alcohol dehydrogenase family)